MKQKLIYPIILVVLGLLTFVRLYFDLDQLGWFTESISPLIAVYVLYKMSKEI
jgi:hypothetical protein